MPRRKQTRGACAYCGKDYTRGGMTKHLNACADRKEAIRKADDSPIHPDQACAGMMARRAEPPY